MTTLERSSEPPPKLAPMPRTLAEPAPSSPPAAADASPTASGEILPMLIETPAWPRIFPGL